ncbi:fumarylacetoacetate hydrolase family protein [Paracandidimonas soli]|uniref:2-keto-4-pentenoate hydratase/2-oxohepta-3-ene-1,7-dioic acid hydratase in catechol pathway n=1 Tax=Paracandidimonas soli TaxID=1917182 RepID=A0A4R3UZ42_9BURK|nr:fumarylacetoacetate hydrolase family protein [Paracandidimonas soli]TCU96058.1 2-keto-4-pentenoate hydratase/2-oxohepta-3-ene-1,7-dioic acid hydratase in catechol pathway [Paracandidimonas soli]
MKLLTFAGADDKSRLGMLLADGRVLDVTAAWQAAPHALQDRPAPRDVMEAIALGDPGRAALQEIADAAGKQAQLCLDEDKVRYLPPIPRPPKNVICVGRNYKAHIIEGNLARGRAADDFPKAIELFTKPPTTLTAHKQAVSRHAAHTKLLDYEIELGIVIGKTGKDIDPANAMEHVFGYTVVNDISARDLQVQHGQWFKGKSLDGTCPMGPVVATRDEISQPGNLDLELTVNGEVRQSANTSDLLFDIPSIIAQVSIGFTLQEGDIIATGTPSGVGMALNPPRSLEPGDRICARIEGIGELVTTITE